MGNLFSGGGSGAEGSINPFSVIGSAAGALSNFLPEVSEAQGDRGALNQGLNAAYDGIADAAMSIPPVGTAIGGIMKVGGFLTKGLNALGAGTDGMSTADAVLGSPFFALTPFGLLNGLAGEKADTFTKDSEVFAQMGNSYAGTEGQADVAARKSGKKYGLFSLGAMQDANRMMRKTQQAQDDIRNIQDTTNTQDLLALGGLQATQSRLTSQMNGGLQQGMIRAAKQGTALFNKDAIQKAKSFLLKKGDKIHSIDWPEEYTSNEDFVKFLQSCPEDLHIFSDESPTIFSIWESIGQPSNYDEIKDLIIPIFTKNTEGKYQLNPDYLFMINDANSPEFIIGNDSEQLQSFKEGGQLNVIPEGALHAEKHHLEKIDDSLKGNITHKGIPVVSIDEEGNIEQQAEVERNELILNLETTELIEECRTAYHQTDSPTRKKEIAEEAGRIFAKSVIENTDDRTNLMEQV